VTGKLTTIEPKGKKKKQKTKEKKVLPQFHKIKGNSHC
jgi:hypothetical protein